MDRFRALEISLETIRGLREPVAVIRRRSERLAVQVEMAATSVALNLAEGSRRAGKDRLHHFRIAAGSAAEVRCGLRVAEAWGYLDEESIAGSLERLDALLAILWSLSGDVRRRRGRRVKNRDRGRDRSRDRVRVRGREAEVASMRVGKPGLNACRSSLAIRSRILPLLFLSRSQSRCRCQSRSRSRMLTLTRCRCLTPDFGL